jgi:hypothetical protein
MYLFLILAYVGLLIHTARTAEEGRRIRNAFLKGFFIPLGLLIVLIIVSEINYPPPPPIPYSPIVMTPDGHHLDHLHDLPEWNSDRDSVPLFGGPNTNQR